MKRILSIILSILMILSVSVAFYGCNKDDDKKEKKEKTSQETPEEPKTEKPAKTKKTEDNRPDEDKIIGEWVAEEIDIADNMNDIFEGEKIFSDLKIVFTFEFDDDTCEISANKSENRDFINKFDSQFAAWAEKELDEAIASSGITEDEFYEEIEVADREEALNEMITFSGEDIINQLSEEGFYKIKDGKLYLTDEEGEIDEEDYYEYTFRGSNFVLLSCSDSEVELFTFPMTLTKVN